MKANRARVLLPRSAMRVVGALAMTTMSSALQGCLIPPEGTIVPTIPNLPPEIEVATLDPPGPLFRQNVDVGQENCPCNLAATIIERDNCLVDIRLVADNNYPNRVKLLDSDNDVRLARRDTGENCPPPPYRRRLSFTTETQRFSGSLLDPHTISLFVKDTTDEWAVPEELIGDTDALNDAGALKPETPDNPRDGTVVSYNWTVQFVQMSCNQ